MSETASKPYSLGILCLLFVAHFMVTVAFNTAAPLLYLVNSSIDNVEVREGLDQLKRLSESTDLSGEGQSMMESQRIVRPLLAKVPWLPIAILGSILIYSLLGFWAFWLLPQPHRVAIFIPLSIFLGQNPLIAPLNLQAMGLGNLALSFLSMVLLLALQFVLFAVGMNTARRFRLYRKSRKTATQEPSKENLTDENTQP